MLVEKASKKTPLKQVKNMYKYIEREIFILTLYESQNQIIEDFLFFFFF